MDIVRNIGWTGGGSWYFEGHIVKWKSEWIYCWTQGGREEEVDSVMDTDWREVGCGYFARHMVVRRRE